MARPSDQILRDMHRRMIRIRLFEEAAGRLFEAGRMPGFIHLYVGQEAVAAGVCAALRDDDQISSTHRGHGHLVAKGGDLSRMMAELMGKATGYCHGKGGSMHICDLDLNMLGANGIVGGGVPIAVGAGFANKYGGSDTVSVVFFGDGATNIGAFHEAANMAAALELPVLFVCENNEYAEFTRRDRDPIPRHEALMTRVGAMTLEEAEAARAEVGADVEAAVEFAEQSPMPDPADLLTDVYSDAGEHPDADVYSDAGDGRRPPAPA